MTRDYRLVSYLGDYQVCSKARRWIEGEIRIQWIYGRERLVFCEAGKEDAVYQLPDPEHSNFFGDRFTFAIDIVDENGKIIEKIGGAMNVVVAQRAFDEVLHHHSPKTRLHLRQGGFIMREERGIGDYGKR